MKMEFAGNIPPLWGSKDMSVCLHFYKYTASPELQTDT